MFLQDLPSQIGLNLRIIWPSLLKIVRIDLNNLRYLSVPHQSRLLDPPKYPRPIERLVPRDHHIYRAGRCFRKRLREIVRELLALFSRELHRQVYEAMRICILIRRESHGLGEFILLIVDLGPEEGFVFGDFHELSAFVKGRDGFGLACGGGDGGDQATAEEADQ